MVGSCKDSCTIHATAACPAAMCSMLAKPHTGGFPKAKSFQASQQPLSNPKESSPGLLLTGWSPNPGRTPPRSTANPSGFHP